MSDMPEHRLGVIILAAGCSRRFQGDKLLATLPDGRCLIDHALAAYLPLVHEGAWPIHVAIHEANLPLIAHVSKMDGCLVVPVRGSDRSMGLSIAQAVATLDAQQMPVDRGFAGWLLALADMPAVRRATIAQLISHFDGKNILQPCCIQQSTRSDPSYDASVQTGHPVIFPRDLTGQLIQLTEDRGGRSIIKQFPERVTTLLTDDSGILLDIDTPADLQQWVVQTV
jgi:molybdenum cofactor cytidylyltransferase